MNLDNFLFLVCLGMNTNKYEDGQSILWWWIQHLQVCWSRLSTASLEALEALEAFEILKNELDNFLKYELK